MYHTQCFSYLPLAHPNNKPGPGLAAAHQALAAHHGRAHGGLHRPARPQAHHQQQSGDAEL